MIRAAMAFTVVVLVTALGLAIWGFTVGETAKGGFGAFCAALNAVTLTQLWMLRGVR